MAATSSTSTQRLLGCFSSRRSVRAVSSETPCFLASGPTCADATTCADALAILDPLP